MQIIHCDTFVYGATPGGIAAALSAAREGCRTILACPGRHIGGMSASGLCTTDAVRRDAFGGILLEFVGRVRRYYLEKYGPTSEAFVLCRDGWWYEPHVAALVFREMLAEQPNLDLLPDMDLAGVSKASATRLNSAFLKDDRDLEHEIVAGTFIDATYEADLAAMAGVPSRVGREGRSEFGEPLAGEIYFDWRSGKVRPPTTGRAHPGIQAYCFRHTLTDAQANQVRVEKPDYYNDLLPSYLPLLEDIEQGRIRSMENVTMMSVLPNRKVDANGHIEGLTSFNLPGENWDYPEASAEQRARIVQRHRLHAHGLIYFMQNDLRVPQFLREEFGRWQFCADEYTDYRHQPPQLYVRQARRIRGRTTLTQHDYSIEPGADRTPRHRDSIAVAEHSFDIHPCQNRRVSRDGWMEGVLWFPDKANGPAQPGQVSYGAIIPEKLDNLLAPVGLSATHIAFSVLRMEPVWMATGEAAGLAAAFSRQTGEPVAAINVQELQKRLEERGQILDYAKCAEKQFLQPVEKEILAALPK